MLWTLPLACALPATTPYVEPAPALDLHVEGDERPTTMGEGVEILRRLLVRSLNETRKTPISAGTNVLPNVDSSFYPGLIHGGVIGADGMLYPAASATAKNARGFHLPTVGATYTVDVTVPIEFVSQKPAPDAEPEEDANRDEWDSVLDSVRKGEEQKEEAPAAELWQLDYYTDLNQGIWGGQPKMVLDADAIEAATDAVLETLVKHGRRLELGEGESITVAMTIKGRDPFQANLVSPNAGGQVVDDLVWFSYASASANGQSASDLETRVIVRVPATAFLKKLADAKELRGHAQIHRY